MNDKPDKSKHQKPQIPPVPLWECPNCGQRHFGEYPPDMCDYCHDFTTWRRIGTTGGHNDKPEQREK